MYIYQTLVQHYQTDRHTTADSVGTMTANMQYLGNGAK